MTPEQANKIIDGFAPAMLEHAEKSWRSIGIDEDEIEVLREKFMQEFEALKTKMLNAAAGYIRRDNAELH